MKHLSYSPPSRARLSAVVTLVAVSALALAACGGSSDSKDASAKGSVKIGLLIAQTGPAAEFGKEEIRAIKAVVDEVNGDGGVDGRKIELVTRDSKTDPTEAVRVAQQLITDDKVIGIIGPTTGSETLAMVNVAMRAKVPVFAMSGTPSVTDPTKDYFPWVFRESLSPRVEIPAGVEKIADEGHKNVAVFYSEDAYGEEGSKTFEKVGKTKGVSVPASVSAPATATDLTSVANRIRNAKPDAVYMATSSPTLGGGLLRKLAEVGLDVPVYGVAGAVQRQIITNAGDAAENLVATAMVNPDAEGLAPLDRLDKLMAGNGEVAGFGALQGANSIATVIHGLESGAKTGEELRDAVQDGKEFEGYAAGPLRYTKDDHDGWGPDTLFFVTVRDGKFVNVE